MGQQGFSLFGFSVPRFNLTSAQGFFSKLTGKFASVFAATQFEGDNCISLLPNGKAIDLSRPWFFGNFCIFDHKDQLFMSNNGLIKHTVHKKVVDPNQ